MLFPFLRTNLFFRNRVIFINLVLCLVLDLIILIALYFKIEPRVEPVALKYTIYFGIDMIGSWWHIFIFPLMGLMAILINFTLAYLVFLKTKTLAYFLVLTSSVIQILLLIISVLIILLNS